MHGRFSQAKRALDAHLADGVRIAAFVERRTVRLQAEKMERGQWVKLDVSLSSGARLEEDLETAPLERRTRDVLTAQVRRGLLAFETPSASQLASLASASEAALVIGITESLADRMWEGSVPMPWSRWLALNFYASGRGSD